jgi:hypothetical protein
MEQMSLSLQFICRVSFALENELNALGIKKDISLTLPILTKRKLVDAVIAEWSLIF